MKQLVFGALISLLYVSFWKLISFEFAVIAGIVAIITDMNFNDKDK